MLAGLKLVMTTSGCRVVLYSWVVDYMMSLHPPCLSEMCDRAYLLGLPCPFFRALVTIQFCPVDGICRSSLRSLGLTLFSFHVGKRILF